MVDTEECEAVELRELNLLFCLSREAKPNKTRKYAYRCHDKPCGSLSPPSILVQCALCHHTVRPLGSSPGSAIFGVVDGLVVTKRLLQM